MKSQASQTQIIDLTGDEVAEKEEAGVPVLAHCDQNRIEYGPSQSLTTQTAGPITRYVFHALAIWCKGLRSQAWFAGSSYDF